MNGSALDYGVAGVALGVVFAALRMLDRYLPSPNGKEEPKLECPNKIHTLAKTLGDIDSHLKRLHIAGDTTMTGVLRLVEQHAAGPDGVERFKISPRLERVIEETGEHQRDMLVEVRGMTKSIAELVEFLKKHNGSNRK